MAARRAPMTRRMYPTAAPAPPMITRSLLAAADSPPRPMRHRPAVTGGADRCSRTGTIGSLMVPIIPPRPPPVQGPSGSRGAPPLADGGQGRDGAPLLLGVDGHVQGGGGQVGVAHEGLDDADVDPGVHELGSVPVAQLVCGAADAGPGHGLGDDGRDGLPADVPGTAHQLRHWYGTELVHSGVDIRIVQTLMRHADLSTTAL